MAARNPNPEIFRLTLLETRKFFPSSPTNNTPDDFDEVMILAFDRPQFNFRVGLLYYVFYGTSPEIVVNRLKILAAVCASERTWQRLVASETLAESLRMASDPKVVEVINSQTTFAESKMWYAETFGE